MPVESAQEPSESALVRLHRAGHDEAFGILYREYFPRLVRLCRRWAVDEPSAEDLAQETLVRALVYLSSFDESRPMWPWLKVIASRLAADRADKQAREVPLGTHGGGIEDPLRWVEERPLLSRALARLNQRHRLAIRLRYMEEWTPGEAAEFLGLSRPAFRQLLARARRRLQAEYRRASDGVIGLVAAPVRWIRSIGQRTAERLQREASSSPAASGILSSEAFQQLVSGFAALLLLLGGLDGPAGAGRGSSHPGGPELAAPRTEPAGDVDPLPSGGSPPAPGGRSHGGGGEASGGPAEYAHETVENIKDPNRKVKQPEDAQITSIEFSPNYESDGKVFAAGNARCRDDLCPSVLFVSRDGGGSWARLPAQGFRGEELLLPPGFGARDERLYAMGDAGLQVSRDGGKSFRPATPGGTSLPGPADISPVFHSGDPSILIGGAILTRYRADKESTEPVPLPASPGSFYPAYSPDYGTDETVFVGSVQPAPMGGGMRTVVFRCTEALCSEAPIEGQGELPKLRIPPNFEESGLVYAFTSWGLYASADGGSSFEVLRGEWPEGWLLDVEIRSDGTLLAAVGSNGRGRSGGLLASADGGGSWIKLVSPRLERIQEVEAMGERVLVAHENGGLACSSDGGATWGKRC